MSYYENFEVVSLKAVKAGSPVFFNGVKIGEYDAEGVDLAIFWEDEGADERFFIDAPKAGETADEAFDKWLEETVKSAGEDFREVHLLTEGPNSAKAYYLKTYSV